MDALCLLTEGFICSSSLEQVLVENIGINIETGEPEIAVKVIDQAINVTVDEPEVNVDVPEETDVNINVTVDEPIINIEVCNEFNN